jgi:PAS domain S-box-containing protein
MGMAHRARVATNAPPEGWLPALAASCRDGVAGFDRELHCVVWNPAMERISGLTCSEVLGQHVFQVFPLLENSDAAASLGKALQGQPTVAANQPCWSRDGSDPAPPGSHSRRYDIHYLPVHGPGGEVVGGMAVFRDVPAEEDRAAGLRHRQQEVLHRIMGEAPLGFLLVDDRTDEVVFANRKFCEIWGLEGMAEPICSGKVTHSFLIPLCAPLVRNPEAFAEFCKPPAFPEYRTTTEEEIEFRDGRVIKRFSTQIGDEDHVYSGRLCVFEDITDRRRIAEALRQKQAELRLIIDSMPILVAYIDRSEHYRYANKTYRDWFGEDPAGKHVLEVLTEDAYAMSRPYREAALRGESTHFETYFQFRTGPRRYVHCSYIPDIRADGSVPGCIVFLYDLTERKREEEALLEAEKLATMGRMAATIAHEINNPLASITNLVYLLESSNAIGEQEQQWISLLAEEVGRVSQITRQTLGFYKQSSHPVRVNLSALLDEVLALLAQDIAGQHARVIRDLGSNVELEGYAIELRQVAINLLTNALDAVGNYGTIGVRTGNLGNKVELVIYDHGPGIPEQVVKRIFEPFFTTKGQKGTGLGLWVTRGIVEKHGGSINVHTETTPGHSGTSFTILLPKRFRHLE